MKELKLAYSRIIPFKGFYAITFFGYLIRRKEYKGKPVSNLTMNHEMIHAAQARDFLSGIGYIPFYILYILEWLLKLIPCAIKRKSAYRAISFEQEAYKNELNFNYLNSRKRFSWTKYIFKL